MNILILRVSSIGDVIHTIPSVLLIKKAFPGAKISWIVQKKASTIITGQNFLEKVWIIPDNFLYPKQWIETIKTLKKVRKTKWNAILDFQGITKTSILSLFLKGKRYGFNAKNAKFPLTSHLNSKQTNPVYKNIIQKNLALASDMIQDKKKEKCNACPSLKSLIKNFKMLFPEQSKRNVNSWLNNKKIDTFIAIAPNTTWESKHWPLESWKKLLYILTKNQKLISKYKIVLIGKHFGKQAKHLTSEIKKNKLPVYILPKWNLITASYVLSKASLLVAPDTGLLHMADLLNINSLGILGPTSAKMHGAFLKNENIKNSIQIECIHKYQKTHGKLSKNNKKAGANVNCMYKLSPEVLYEKIVTALKR